jgi:hypothetical protein
LHREPTGRIYGEFARRSRDDGDSGGGTIDIRSRTARISAGREAGLKEHHMFKRILAGGAAVALAAGVLVAGTGAVSAATPSTTPVAGDVVVHGTGVLDAQGNGVAAVRGAIDLHVTVDNGVLFVRDFNNNAIVHVTGNGQTIQWLGYTVYFGVTEATVVAPNVGVAVAGHNIDLHVTGHGWAFLKGEGTFTANGYGPFPWTPQGTFGSVTP